MTDSSSSSVRYASLWKGIEKVLSESRSSISVADAVEIAYGDEAELFGGTNVLQKVVEGMLDDVNHTVTQKMKEYMEHTSSPSSTTNETVPSSLKAVEDILRAFDEYQQAHQKAEEMDAASAKQALQQVQLPPHVTPMDVVQYRAHQLMLEERDALQRKIDQLEEESDALETQMTHAQAELEARIQTLERVGEELDRTADICSSIS